MIPRADSQTLKLAPTGVEELKQPASVGRKLMRVDASRTMAMDVDVDVDVQRCVWGASDLPPFHNLLLRSRHPSRNPITHIKVRVPNSSACCGC